MLASHGPLPPSYTDGKKQPRHQNHTSKTSSNNSNRSHKNNLRNAKPRGTGNTIYHEEAVETFGTMWTDNTATTRLAELRVSGSLLLSWLDSKLPGDTTAGEGPLGRVRSPGAILEPLSTSDSLPSLRTPKNPGLSGRKFCAERDVEILIRVGAGHKVLIGKDCQGLKPSRGSKENRIANTHKGSRMKRTYKWSPHPFQWPSALYRRKSKGFIMRTV